MERRISILSVIAVFIYVTFSNLESAECQRQRPFPQNNFPQQSFPQQSFPQNNFPQQSFPQNNFPQQSFPQNNFPQDPFPQQSFPQEIFSVTEEQPQGLPQPQQPSQRPSPCDSIICTAEYNPLCASRNGQTRTFNNRCLFKRENQCSTPRWEFFRLGLCAPILNT